MMGFGMGCGSLGALFAVIFLVAIVALAIWVLGALFPRGPRAAEAGGSQPLEILKARYARGEISREEYEQMRKDLMS